MMSFNIRLCEYDLFSEQLKTNCSSESFGAELEIVS